MIQSFFWNKKRCLWAYGGGVLLSALLYAQVSLSVKINAWYGGFYDLLQHVEKHTFTEFQQNIIDCLRIAVPWTAFAIAMNQSRLVIDSG